MSESSKLFVDLRVGETLVIEGGIAVRLYEKSGQLARLALEFSEAKAVSKVGKPPDATAKKASPVP